MSAGLSIEPMGGRHVTAVRAIDELAYPNPWSVATWRNELASTDRHHVVAIDARGDERSVVGHAGLLFVVDEVHVTTVAVHPDVQGRGIASRMLVVLLREARDRAVGAATLEVRATDVRTQRLYARFGFRPVGVRRSYYSRPTDDAVVMWLEELGSGSTGTRLDRIATELDDDRVTPVSERTT